jgi:hypothetical protein
MDRSLIKYVFGVFIIGFMGFGMGYIAGDATVIEHNNTVYKTQACPLCNACPPEKICPEPDPCPKCNNNCPPVKQCPEPDPCPKSVTQEYIDSSLQDIVKMRPKAESPAWQDGYYTMRNYCLEAFGYKNISQFREARSLFDSDLFYTGGTQAMNEGYFTFRQFEQYGNMCFNISQYPDQLGRKRWNWNLEDCKGSTITVCHL